jgi:hypothetical protein
MVRRYILAFLIALLPIQSWAVVDMRLEREKIQMGLVDSQLNDAHHACHQEVAKSDSEDSSTTKQSNCHSCSLCMAFGGIFFHNPVVQLDSPSQSFFTKPLILFSQELTLTSKPPIH